MSSYTYEGSELSLFATAVTWKGYLRQQIAPFIGTQVLEVGAGLGGTTRLFVADTVRRWVCLEPDALLAARITDAVAHKLLPACCEVAVGTLRDLGPEPQFDTILYIDVLEHIEGDAAEASEAVRRLVPGGNLIVLSPAHQWLFSPFDKAVGHFRRYDRATLEAAMPANLSRQALVYLDSVGMLANGVNRLMLRSSMPTASQIALWDRVIVPVSKVLDPVFGYRLGKSILGVWRKHQ